MQQNFSKCCGANSLGTLKWKNCFIMAHSYPCSWIANIQRKGRLVSFITISGWYLSSCYKLLVNISTLTLNANTNTETIKKGRFSASEFNCKSEKAVKVSIPSYLSRFLVLVQWLYCPIYHTAMGYRPQAKSNDINGTFSRLPAVPGRLKEYESYQMLFLCFFFDILLILPWNRGKIKWTPRSLLSSVCEPVRSEEENDFSVIFLRSWYFPALYLSLLFWNQY